MKRTLTALLLVGLFLSSCGKKNDSNNAQAPGQYTFPVVPVPPNGVLMDIASLRTTFDTASLSANVAVGDYYDYASISNFSFNYNFNFFGKQISSSTNNTKRYTVTSADANYIELDNGTTIDRPSLVEKIFSDSKSNYILKPRRACVYTQELGIIPATVIEKYQDYGGWYGQQSQYLVERVVVSNDSRIPLYLNPLSVETGYSTKYIRRFKSSSSVVTIIFVGNCGY